MPLQADKLPISHNYVVGENTVLNSTSVTHSCENTSLQNVSVENLQFYGADDEWTPVGISSISDHSILVTQPCRFDTCIIDGRRCLGIVSNDGLVTSIRIDGDRIDKTVSSCRASKQGNQRWQTSPAAPPVCVPNFIVIGWEMTELWRRIHGNCEKWDLSQFHMGGSELRHRSILETITHRPKCQIQKL